MNAQTGFVRAEGTIIGFGRRKAFAEARPTDTADRLLASATSTLLGHRLINRIQIRAAASFTSAR